MMLRTRAVPAACGLLAAALLAGCGGGDDGGKDSAYCSTLKDERTELTRLAG